MRLFETGADLGEYLFRITDNGGETADRYTVIFSDGDYLTMSAYPSHPQGVSLWGEAIDVQGVADRIEAGEEVDLSWGCLPESIRAHVLSRVNEGWRDFLEAVAAKAPHAVAPNRDAAEENDGLNSSGGKGLYLDDAGAYWIKRDNYEQGDDYGPFTDPVTALRWTLPEAYSLAGEEYHSTVMGDGAPHSETAHPEIMAAVAALEAKRENDRNGDEPLADYEGQTYPVKGGGTRAYGVWYNFGSNVSYMQRGEDSFRMRLDTTGEIVKPAGSAGDDAISHALYTGEDAETYARFNFGDDFQPKA